MFAYVAYIFSYILNLAFADSLFLLSLPFEAVSEIRGHWLYGETFCKIKEAVMFINFYASIYFLLVSKNRKVNLFKVSLRTLLLRIKRHGTVSEITPFPVAISERGPMGVFVGHANLGFTADETAH